MFRSARQGRQGRKIAGATDHRRRDSKSFKPTQADNSTTLSKRKTYQKKPRSDGLSTGLNEDQIYDYQVNNHPKGNRLTSNQIDDHRLIGSSKRTGSSKDEENDEELDEIDRIDHLVERYQQENESGFNSVHSDDDESIDSDEAMGELDDHQLQTKKARRDKKVEGAKRSATQVRFADIDPSKASEASEDETDSDHDEFIDASTMLDLGADSDQAFSEDESQNSDQIDCGLNSSSDDDDGDLDLSESEEEDGSKLRNLAEIVDNLPSLTSQKRKETLRENSTERSTDIPSKKRKLIPVQTESRNEGEMLPSTTSAGNGEGRAADPVKLEDLLSNLTPTVELSDFKKILKPLASTKSTKTGPIPAPLETLLQQKIEREAAYELTKKEMTKWDETTKLAQGLSGKSTDGKNRLVVPANKISSTDKDPDTTRWNMHFTPVNNVENQVLGLLETSQISGKKLLEEESEQMASLGPIPQHFREKAIQSKMARELLFRAERKAKRIAKIKSKAFRRIRKKEKQRKSLSGRGEEPDLDLLEELDGIDGGHRVQTKTEEMEIERARERVTLKHSNQGQWAKKVAGLKGLGSDINTAIQERIHREELLKKKISGVDSDDSDAAEEDSEFDSDSDVGVAHIKAHALHQLSALDSQAPNINPDEGPPKGLFAMKFMQNAMAAKERKAEEARTELRQLLLEGNPEDLCEEEHISNGVKVQGNPGRLLFNPDVFPRAVKQSNDEDLLASNQAAQSSTFSSQKTTKTSGPHLRVMALDPNHGSKNDHAPKSPSNSEPVLHAEANPWLALSSSGNGGTVSRMKDLNPHSKNQSNTPTLVAEKAKLKAEKRKRKQSSERGSANQDARVDIDMDVFMGAKALESMENNNGDECGEDSIIRTGQVDSHGRTAFEQRELVQQAFADDGVVAQFQEEKRKRIEKDAPQELDVTLPGWGDWVGKGSTKSKHSKKFIKKIGGVEPNKRLDSNMSNVIILEQASKTKTTNAKKLSKYQLKDLPFPYTNQQQLELKLNHAIGPEFNTRLNHRHLTRPDVLLKPGVVIEPVDKPV